MRLIEIVVCATTNDNSLISSGLPARHKIFKYTRKEEKGKEKQAQRGEKCVWEKWGPQMRLTLPREWCQLPRSSLFIFLGLAAEPGRSPHSRICDQNFRSDIEIAFVFFWWAKNGKLKHLWHFIFTKCRTGSAALLLIGEQITVKQIQKKRLWFSPLLRWSSHFSPQELVNTQPGHRPRAELTYNTLCLLSVISEVSLRKKWFWSFSARNH